MNNIVTYKQFWISNWYFDESWFFFFFLRKKTNLWIELGMRRERYLGKCGNFGSVEHVMWWQIIEWSYMADVVKEHCQLCRWWRSAQNVWFTCLQYDTVWSLLLHGRSKCWLSFSGKNHFCDSAWMILEIFSVTFKWFLINCLGPRRWVLSNDDWIFVFSNDQYFKFLQNSLFQI